MNFMLDLETVGVRPTSGILSIGVVPFDDTQVFDDVFYSKIELDDSMTLGFTTDDSTMLWWNAQKDEVREEAFSGEVSVRDSISQLSAYLKRWAAKGEELLVWGNGANFDNVLIANAYELLSLKKPWSYSNDRCFRTLKALYPMLPYIPPMNAHNALDDALAQAIHAVKVLNWIKNGSIGAGNAKSD